MKTLFKWAFRLLILFIVLGVAFVLLVDTIAKSVAQSRIRAETGMDAKIGKLTVGLASPTVTIEDLKLYNTSDFGGSMFLDIPEIYVEYNRNDLASAKLRLKLVRFNLAEVNIIKSTNGPTNLEALQEKMNKKSSATNSALPLEFVGIDTLNLTLGKIKYSSLSQPQDVKEINLGVNNQVISNIRTVKDINQALMNIMLKKGVDFLGPIVAGKSLKDAGKSTEKSAKKLLESITSPLKK